jgi:hypothetical protein
MTDHERLLDEIYVEKEKAKQLKKEDADKEAAEEKDKYERLNAVFDSVEAHHREREVVKSTPENLSSEKSSDLEAAESGGSYGRGNKRGQQHCACCNPSLSPDVLPDKLSQAVNVSAEIASAVN